MRFLIMGTGGAGGYFGGRLAQAGEDVTFVARGEHAAAVRAGGLRVDSVKGDFTVRPARVVEHAAEVPDADCVLIATKTWQLPEAAESIRHLRGAAILPLQNGVEAPGRTIADRSARGGFWKRSPAPVSPRTSPMTSTRPYGASSCSSRRWAP